MACAKPCNTSNPIELIVWGENETHVLPVKAYKNQRLRFKTYRLAHVIWLFATSNKRAAFANVRQNSCKLSKDHTVNVIGRDTEQCSFAWTSAVKWKKGSQGHLGQWVSRCCRVYFLIGVWISRFWFYPIYLIGFWWARGQSLAFTLCNMHGSHAVSTNRNAWMHNAELPSWILSGLCMSWGIRRKRDHHV